MTETLCDATFCRSTDWMEGPRIFYSCWSATVVSMIYLFYSKGMRQQLSPGISWMNGRPKHLLLMFDQTLWFLWCIYSIARGMQQQLNQESAEWMEGPRISYSCLISHCGFYDTLTLVILCPFATTSPIFLSFLINLTKFLRHDPCKKCAPNYLYPIWVWAE